MQILRDYMSSPVISISPQANIFEAAKKMTDHKIGCLLVQENGEYVGIITRSDLVNRVLAKNRDPATTRVADVYTKPLLTMDYLLTVDETREKLLRKNIKRLAVTQQGKVVGVFSTKDLIKT